MRREALKRGKNPILFQVGLLQLRAKSSRSTNLHQEEKSVVLPQLADPSVHWQSQAGVKGRRAPLVLAGGRAALQPGNGRGQGPSTLPRQAPWPDLLPLSSAARNREARESRVRVKEKTWHPYSRLLEQLPRAGLPILSGICGHMEGGRGGPRGKQRS